MEEVMELGGEPVNDMLTEAVATGCTAPLTIFGIVAVLFVAWVAKKLVRREYPPRRRWKERFLFIGMTAAFFVIPIIVIGPNIPQDVPVCRMFD